MISPSRLEKLLFFIQRIRIHQYSLYKKNIDYKQINGGLSKRN